MARNVARLERTGAVVIFVGALIWQSLYDASGQSMAVGLVAPVNASAWEHLKALFYPALAWAIAERPFVGRSGWGISTAAGGTVALVVGGVLGYVLPGILGPGIDAAEIVVLALGVGTGQLVKYVTWDRGLVHDYWNALGIGWLLSIVVLFVLATVLPPEGPLFRDPVTGASGIP